MLDFLCSIMLLFFHPKVPYWHFYKNANFSFIYLYQFPLFRKIAAKEIKEAWKRREARYKRNPNTKVRKFEFLPKKFDPEAEDYSKMIGPFDQLDSRTKTVPPLILALIKDKGIGEVVKLIVDGSLPILDVACHSQAGRHPYTIWTFLTPPPFPNVHECTTMK